MDNSDVAVLDRQGKPVLAVEAKSRFDATSESWAAGTLRNLLAHGSVPDVPYFLFALPDFFYLWKDPKRKAEGLSWTAIPRPCGRTTRFRPGTS